MSNTVEFRLTVEGATEGEAQVMRLRTALSGVALSLDRNIASMLATDAADQKVTQSTDRYQASMQAWVKENALAEASAGRGYSAHLALAAATNAAREAVQGATAPTVLWAKGISDAAAAAAAGAPVYGRLAAGFGLTGAASRQFGGDLKSAHRELFEGARLTRRFVDAIGEAIPSLSGVTGLFTGLGRETRGFTVAQVGATAGALAFVAVLGAWGAALKGVLDTQIAANIAVKGLDFSGMDAALKKSIDAWDSYEAKVELAGDATQNFNLRSVAGLEIAVDKIRGKTAAMAAEVLINATAWDKTWQSMGRAIDTGKAEVSQIDATTASLKLQREAATTPAELEATFQTEADLARKRAKIAADDIAFTRQVVSNRIDGMVKIANLSGNALLAAKLQADADQYRANTAKLASGEIQKGETAATAALIAGSKARAAMTASEIQDAGKLIEIKGRIATEAIRASQSEIDARMAVAKADADFFGTSLAGLAQYQTARRASIVQESAAELAILEDLYAKERQAQLTKAGGLQGPEQQAAYRQLAILAQEYEAKRQQLSDQTAQKLRENALKETLERQANYARDVALVAATYAQEEALGQGDLAVKLNFLRQQGQNENLSLQQKRQYQLQAYTEARSLDEALAQYHQAIGATMAAQDLARLRSLADGYAANSTQRIAAERTYAAAVLAVEGSLFTRLKAFGLTTGTEEVKHLADLASRYKENSEQRIAAETKWATATLGLRQQVADSGKSLIQKTIDALASEGKSYGSLDDVMQRVAADQKSAAGEIDSFASGGTVNFQKLKKAMDLSGDFGNFAKQGVSAGEAMRAGMDSAQNAVRGILESVSGLQGVFTQSGAAGKASFEGIDKAIRDARWDIVMTGQDVGKVATLIEGAGRRDATAFDGLKAGVPTAMKTGLDGALGLVDGFFTTLQGKFESGTSRLADTWTRSFMTELRRALDAESNAN